MRYVTVERRIAAPREQVWPEVSELPAVLHWHPTITKVDLIGSESHGEGAARVCTFEDGSHVREEVIKEKAGEHLDIAMSEYSFPVDDMKASIHLTPEEDGSRVSFTLAFEPRWGAIGKALASLVMIPKMRKTLASVLEGLDAHVTGQAPLGVS